MIESLTELLYEVEDLGVKDYAGYLDLSRDTKKELEELFWRYFYVGPGRIREEATKESTIAVSEDFRSGITQSLLYAEKILILTSGTRSDHSGGKEFKEESAQTFFAYLPLLKSGLVDLIPISHHHLGLDEWDDSDEEFDPIKVGVMRFDKSLQGKIQKEAHLGADPKSENALLSLNLNFPLVSDIDNEELVALLKNEEILYNYRRELRKLHSLRQGAVSERSFLDEVKAINERIIELNVQVRQSKLQTRLSLIEGTIGGTATVCSLFLPFEIATIIKSIVGASTLLSVSSSVKAYIAEQSKLRRSPYYFAWQLLK